MVCAGVTTRPETGADLLRMSCDLTKHGSMLRTDYEGWTMAECARVRIHTVRLGFNLDIARKSCTVHKRLSFLRSQYQHTSASELEMMN